MNFIRHASVTVWVLPAIGLAFSVVFNNQLLLIFFSASILLTQVLVWGLAPEVWVQLEASDHLPRIFIFSVLIFLAFFTNRIFIYRLKENENQANIQKMILNISAEFVNVSVDNVEGLIGNMLRLSGEQYQVDRTLLFCFSQDQTTITCTHEWSNQGIVSFKDTIREVPVDNFSWWMKKILKGCKVHIPDVELLPPGPDKDVLKKQRVQSLICFPIMNNGKVLGFLGLVSVEKEKIWREDHQESLKVLVNILADALVRVAAEKEITNLAYHDSLTGLANRTFFIKGLQEEMDLARAAGSLVGLIMLDLDSFKHVNDSMGHDGGDEVLKQVSRRLRECLRPEDTIARFGGDEFLIMLGNINRVEEIDRIANRIVRSFQQPLIYKEHQFCIRVSAGIAVFPLDSEETETLVKNADLALYSAKGRGKNNYRFCSSALKEGFMQKMRLMNSLNKAQERNELVLYYQPQVNVATEKITGLEALIRWKHPEMGMIYPDTFIPLAEQTGVIHSIGEWVLRNACRQAVAWQKLGIPPISMAVNLSVQQFRDANLVETVRSVLGETGLSPRYLELEITESCSVQEADIIIPVLNELKQLGVSIAIDDFGTGYSSFNRLKMLPIDRIKIGMQFIHAITSNHKDKTIVKIIIQLAKSLNLKVVAEGVETEKQLTILAGEGCDEVQGYYFYKPMPGKDIEALLLNKRKLVM